MQLFDRVEELLWLDAETMPLAKNNGKDVIPTICAYYPPKEKNNHKAVIIFPGGGYAHLAEHEGKGYAEFLSANGYNAFVVKYRLGPDGYRFPCQLSDGSRAVRVIRSQAKELDIDENKIGVMGSSAGGHLAACCSNIYDQALFAPDEKQDKELSRPNFAILCYPVISGVDKFSHIGSFQNLLGEDCSSQEYENLSMHLQINDRTPISFIWHTFEDTAVPMQNSLLYSLELKNKNIPHEFHIYEKGRHGIGLANGHKWSLACLDFLAEI